MEGREYNMDNQEESLGFRSTIWNLIVTGFFRSVYSTSSQRGQEEMGWETTVGDGSSEHLEYSLTIKNCCFCSNAFTKRSTCVTAPYHQRKIRHEQVNWAKSHDGSWLGSKLIRTTIRCQSKAWVAFIAKDMPCLTHPQSSTRDAWRATGAGVDGKGEEARDSLLRVPPSHHTPRATRRGCYRSDAVFSYFCK